MREYYPAALQAFEDLANNDCLAVLGRAPTPADGRRLSPAQITARAQTRLAANATSTTPALRSSTTLRTEQLVAPDAVTDRLRRQHPAAIGVIAELNRQITDLGADPRGTFCGNTRTPTSTAPCQDLVSSRRPGAR